MEFEHVANALALELVNSIPGRDSTTDWLADPEVASAWADSLGMPLDEPLDETGRARLAVLRSAIAAVFGSIAAGAPADPAAVRVVTGAHARGLERYGYVVDAASVRRDWPGRWSVPALEARFAESAVEELTGDRLGRVKECPSCGWLFVDTSRNHARRWCSMEMCGNRDKAYRHYHRRRAGEPVEDVVGPA
ncbi:CGNR zinc finger domain-containing protein [Agromyces sp. NPDC058064]|uniref:CGNR zinc finger domain-containing protein n=1 Tax=Agromyces sp. NPDC058064 TaxID=3346322 RepID=UPI0036D79CB1